MVNQFDRHPSIAYKDAVGLWWDTYYIRVTVPFPKGFNPKQEFGWGQTLGLRQRYKREIFAKLLKDPSVGDYWRTGTSKGFRYFFKDADTASRFIDENLAYVSEVARPAEWSLVSAIEHAARKDPELCDMKMVLQRRLFFNKFRYCVVFKAPSLEIDEVMERMFEYDPETKFAQDENRVRYKFPNGTRAYLRDLDDVLLLKMCLSKRHLDGFQRVVTETELTTIQEELPLAA